MRFLTGEREKRSRSRSNTPLGESDRREGGRVERDGTKNGGVAAGDCIDGFNISLLSKQPIEICETSFANSLEKGTPERARRGIVRRTERGTARERDSGMKGLGE
jgi:hypothetical protein